MFRKDETINAILYILAHSDRTDIHRVCKVLYYADREHLSKYGRSITGDEYIAMKFGPVPSNVEDIFKALRGRSFFSDNVDDIREKMDFKNDYYLEAKFAPDMDYLSESEVECLDHAIALCRNKDFYELTGMSHDYAWSNTERDTVMSFRNILSEAGEDSEYIDYVLGNMMLGNTFMR